MRPLLRLLAGVLLVSVTLCERLHTNQISHISLEEKPHSFTQPPEMDYTPPEHRRFCSGSSNSRSKPGTNNGIEMLRLMYQNCTRVYGNVEITHLPGSSNGSVISLDFLDEIEEIKGYLLIYNTDVDFISFKNLRVIWGDNVHDDMYALHIEQSDVKEVYMPSLRSVINGSVRVERSQFLCFLNNSIDLREIISYDFEKRYSFDEDSFVSCEKLKCHPNCHDHCWGIGPEDCQTVYRSMCSATCRTGSNACFRTNSSHSSYVDSLNSSHTNIPSSYVYECCHPECEAGCYGPGSSMCYACKGMLQDGQCVSQCGARKKYDRTKGQMVFNPNGYYTHDRYCVKECPSETLIQGDHCVRHCSDGFYHDGTVKGRECTPCDGVCPKACKLEEEISRSNIEQLVNCSSIDGRIVIRKHVFESTIRPYGLTFDDLLVLQTVRSVSDYVEISSFPNLNLSFLDQLEVIEGRKLAGEKYALLISMSDSLTQLRLRSLREVKKGDVLVSRNFGLCYTDNNTFAGIVSPNHQAKVLGTMKTEECLRRHKRCDPSCDPKAGCWGKGNRMCRKCNAWKQNGECVNQCPSEGYFANNSTLECVPCHPECLTCSGSDAKDCLSCRKLKIYNRNVSLGKKRKSFSCLSSCPITYFDNGRGICETCHKACYDAGCTGRSPYAEEGGCISCQYAVLEYLGQAENGSSINREKCLYGENKNNLCADNGLPNYFLALETNHGVLETTCKECSDQCYTCSGKGDSIKDHKCECKNYVFMDGDERVRCESDCSRGYVISEKNGTLPGYCGKCSDLCDHLSGCQGPSPTECHRCGNATIIDDGVTTCVSDCPPDKPFLAMHDRSCNKVDIVAQQKRRNLIVILAVFGLILILLTAIACVFCRCYRYKKELEMEKEFNGPTIPEQIEIDPLVRPNMNRMNLISSDELSHKGRKLGSGAYGVVYAGFYKKNNRKLPVAIKLLQDHTGKAQQEMLDEATKMARMRHEHLLKLVGVCLGNNSIQLVTVLRPLGNLLSYLKKHRQYLIGKDLLLYCYQISSAMKYLYENRLVHRDLAARNVLVKQNNHVEVTDFGLTKLLEYGRDTVTVSEGKVAYKWLAPESLQRAEYTHATDVWAFGVTCWEILTYGQSPYQGMDLLAVRDYLLFGEKRLEQPNNCSLDLYSTMLRCWLSNPESRPTFVTLKDDFHGYCRAPQLFVMDPHSQLDFECVPSQTALLQQILDETETDFQDPLEYDDSISEAGTLAGSRARRLTSTTSQRYYPDPAEKSKNRQQVQMDEGNYLVPNRDGGGVMYTPVVVNEQGDTELLNSHGYYNEVVPSKDYYNAQPNKLIPIKETREQESSGGADIESCL